MVNVEMRDYASEREYAANKQIFFDLFAIATQLRIKAAI